MSRWRPQAARALHPWDGWGWKGYRNGCRKLWNQASPSASPSAKVIHIEHTSVLHKMKLPARIPGSAGRKGTTDLTGGFVLTPFPDPEEKAPRSSHWGKRAWGKRHSVSNARKPRAMLPELHRFNKMSCPGNNWYVLTLSPYCVC